MMIAGIVATAVMVGAGIAITLPSYFRPGPTVLLSYSFSSEQNMPTLCLELADYLKKNELPAVVFLSGEIAEKYPECVRSFDGIVDIGSSTYSYVELPAIQDYSEQLNEVSGGKNAVDIAGNLDSRAFKAPFGSTDENIYSLLTRSGILADFSYPDRYHKYYQDKFIWFDITVYNTTSTISAESFETMGSNEKQIIVQVDFDDSVTFEKVQEVVSKLKTERVVFINASTLTGMQLTVRGGE